MKKIIILLLAIIVLCFMPGKAAAVVDVESTSIFHYIMGMLYFYDENIDGTIKEFEKAVELDGNLLFMQENLMELYFSKKDYEKAEIEAKKILEHDKNNLRAYQYLAEIIPLRGGDISEALGYQKKVIGFIPKDAMAHFYLAALYGQLNDTVSAKKEFKIVLSLDRKNIQAYLLLASLYEYEKKEEEAMMLYKRALKINPDNTEIIDRLGTLQNKQKKFAEAISNFQKSIVVNPYDVKALYNLVLLNDKSGDWKKTAEYLERIDKVNPGDARICVHLGISYIELERYDDAVNILKKVLETDPENDTAQPLLGMAYEYKKMYREASEAFLKSIEKNPDKKEHYFQLGLCYDNLKEYDKSDEAFQKALEIDPKFAYALNYLGYSWAERGVNLDKALANIEAALKVEPDNGSYTDSLGWVYFKLGDYRKAEKILLKASQLLKDPVIFEHLGDTYVKLTKASQALVVYRKAQKLDPGKKELLEKINKLSGK